MLSIGIEYLIAFTMVGASPTIYAYIEGWFAIYWTLECRTCPKSFKPTQWTVKSTSISKYLGTLLQIIFLWILKKYLSLIEVMSILDKATYTFIYSPLLFTPLGLGVKV